MLPSLVQLQTATSGLQTNVTIHGVVVSTDANEWTGLTLKQIIKLKLFAKSQDEMERKFKADRHNVDAGYYGTEFVSPYSDEYHFFIQHLGYVPDDEVVCYVLARPNSDTAVYTRY